MSKKIILAGVALLGLSLSAAQAASKPEATPASGDPVVARVNGEEIHRSDVMRELQMAGPQVRQIPQQMLYPTVLENLVTTKIVSQKGYDAGLNKSPEVKDRLKYVEDQLVAQAYIQKEVEPKVTDAKIKARYEQLLKQYKPHDEVRARHILVKTQAEAEDIIKQIKGGADFAKLASEKSIDTGSAQQGGDLGYFAQDKMVPAFADAAFAMKVGEVSAQPVKTEYGYHVIKIEDRRKSSLPPLAELKEQIANKLGQEMADNEVKELRSKAKIQEFTMDGAPMPKDAAK